MDDLAPSPARMSAEKFDRLGAAGDASVRGRTELRRGVVVRMAPEHLPHGRFKIWLVKRLEAALETAGLSHVVDIDVTVRFTGRDFRPMPDVIVWDGGPLRNAPIPGDKTRICAEISHSTLASDKGDKRREYAEAGVAEYWVVDVNARVLHIFHTPKGGDYSRSETVRDGETATSATLAGVTVVFAPPVVSS